MNYDSVTIEARRRIALEDAQRRREELETMTRLESEAAAKRHADRELRIRIQQEEEEARIRAHRAISEARAREEAANHEAAVRAEMAILRTQTPCERLNEQLHAQQTQITAIQAQLTELLHRR